MLTLDALRRDKRKQILELAHKWGAHNIRVFGSVARGDNRDDSDVDFLVEMESGRTLFDLGGFVADLEDLIGMRVDVVTPGSLHYLRDSILAEATPL